MYPTAPIAIVINDTLKKKYETAATESAVNTAQPRAPLCSNKIPKKTSTMNAGQVSNRPAANASAAEKKPTSAALATTIAVGAEAAMAGAEAAVANADTLVNAATAARKFLNMYFLCVLE